MEMDKILKKLEAFQPERIKWRTANLPEPSLKLFEDMGKAMDNAFKTQIVLSLDIDPDKIKEQTPDRIQECWVSVARMSYKYLALAGGAERERIE